MNLGKNKPLRKCLWLFFLFTLPLASEPIKLALPVAIYTDSGAYQESFIPAGWMGDFNGIRFIEDSKENPKIGTTCMKWIYDLKAKKVHRWAGVYWQFPSNNWGNIDGGLNIQGAKSLSFWARGETGKEIVEFKVGGIYGIFSDTLELSSDKITLSKDWRKYEFVFNDEDLSHVNGGFCWVAAADGQEVDKLVFYVDDIWIR